jgi:hypothetical protein
MRLTLGSGQGSDVGAVVCVARLACGWSGGVGTEAT